MGNEKILQNLSRRKFLRNTVIAAAGTVIIPGALSSCKKDRNNIDYQGQGFNEGVASFDPEIDRVILWTRYTPSPQETQMPELILDVAKDKYFNSALVSQHVKVDTASDNTVYVDVSGLSSNTQYYYRFRNELTSAVSPTGETRTLPKIGEASQVKLAVVSCANYQSGLFNVYGAVAVSEADFVVHLGDYIYEYAAGGYGTNTSTNTLNRAHIPEGEILNLDDYRRRYRQYRSDEQLQLAHQMKPFICVWDDHEIANDAWTDGAENHQASEGDFATRKLYALQAWHEYLPARVTDNAKIYRNFEIAGLVNLIMLDTRLAGRNKQLNYIDFLGATGLNVTQFLQQWQNPQRTILGQEQKDWLSGKLSNSAANWQVIGSQVLMAKVYFPTELLLIAAQLAAGSTDPALLTQYSQLVTELVTIKTRMLQDDPALTASEKARVTTVLPYNLDSWDGYPAEREQIFAAARGKKLISIAGDTHNAWYSTLNDVTGTKVGAEFATASVSSPGFEAIFGSAPEILANFEQAHQLLIEDLQYLNAADRGYVLARFDIQKAEAEWRFVGTLTEKNVNTQTKKSVSEN